MILLQIGAPDTAPPRMNNFSLAARRGVHAVDPVAVLPGGGPASADAVSAAGAADHDALLPRFAIHLAGASPIVGAINIIVTIMNMRAPGDAAQDAAVRRHVLITVYR
jgi:cytochrome c oxidase subunit 1